MIYLRNLGLNTAPPAWRRTVVEQRPSWKAATLADGTRIVVGNPVGIAGHHVDVWWPDDIEPGQRVALDLSTVPASATTDRYEPVLPRAATTDPVGYFGLPTLCGVPLGFDSLVPNGAGFDVRLFARLGAFVLSMRLTVYPGQDEYPAEVRVLHSGAERPQAFAELPSALVDLSGVSSLPAGMRFAYGQSITLRGRYLRRASGPAFTTWDSAEVATLGRDRIGWLGTAYPGSFRGLPAIADIEASLARTRNTWQQAHGSIPANAGQSGAIGEQGFHAGFEPALLQDPAALVAIADHGAQHAKRPCHYARADGTPLDLERAGFVCWNGQPWAAVGAGRTWPLPHITHESTPGNWYGPDLEHLLINHLAADIEYRGSPMAQEELTFQAHVWLASQTTNPAWSSSTQFVSRALGWNSLAACHFYRLLNDRELAERIRVRCIERLRMHRGRWGDQMWDVRQTPEGDMELDRREAPFWCYTYQMAVGVFGAYVAAEMFGDADLKAWAGQAAELCVAQAWDANGTVWERIGLRSPADPYPPASYVQRRTAWTTGGFAQNWTPLALWVACKHNPANERARTLYARTLDARLSMNLPAEVVRWLPPLWGPDDHQGTSTDRCRPRPALDRSPRLLPASQQLRAAVVLRDTRTELDLAAGRSPNSGHLAHHRSDREWHAEPFRGHRPGVEGHAGEAATDEGGGRSMKAVFFMCWLCVVTGPTTVRIIASRDYKP